MRAEKRAKLVAAGFRVGTVAEFLELTPEENELVEFRVALGRLVRRLRERRRLTQRELAAQIGSEQGRISRLESADLSVSVDQMLEAAFALGARRKDVSDALSS